MKKNILRLIISFILIILIFILYLTFVGIETSKFNSRISSQIKNINQDLDLDLKQIKIKFVPKSFSISAKTLGSTLKYKKKILQIETIKTDLSLNYFIKKKFLLTNLKISSKSIELNNFLNFVRSFKNIPETYILEKIVKRGYLISNIELNFDEKGKILDNYKINGLIKDAKISFLKNHSIDKLNFNFKINKQNYLLENIRLNFNKIPLSSKNISIKSKGDDYLVEGEISNQINNFDQKFIQSLLGKYLNRIELKNIEFDTENQFSFKLNKKYRIKDFKLISKINLNNLIVLNNLNLKKFFPESKKSLDLKNHIIDLKYDNENLTIKGNGKILIQKKDEIINYTIKKKNDDFDFLVSLKSTNNPFQIDLLNYKKKRNTELSFNIKGKHKTGEDLILNSVKIKESKNIFEITELKINKNLMIKEFKEIKMDFLDEDNFNNDLKIVKQKKNYLISGKFFNSNKILDTIIADEKSDNTKLFAKNFNFKIDIGEVSLDEKNSIKNLNGKLNIENNEVINSNLTAYFSNNEKLNFTIKSTNSGKVTTLFLDRAEPIVKRYKFIKGYENGKLDFYSIKNVNESTSTLKIYDFKLKELPALTKLLTLASLQGIADILSGEGIRFDEFEMNFKNKKDLMTIDEIYAIGPAISIMMNGYVQKSKIISLRGTLVPATTINKAIGSIPVLGKILVGQKTGEGVFGVSFKIKGPPKKLETTVNPIKTLTPRFITRTLEKIKKTN